MVVMSLFFWAVKAQAAELRFNPAASIVSSGDQFIIDVVLDAGSQDINTIEATLQYPADKLELVETRIAKSVITFWIQEPSVKQQGRVPFGGTIVGGYLGTGGTVFSAVFKTPRQELTTEFKEQITIIGAKGYVNDGLGTAAEVTMKPAVITVVPASTEQEPRVIGVVEDLILPEPFIPEVGQDSSLFENQWFVAFNTEDKQSGIVYYEVQESVSVTPDGEKWQRATSPHVLSDQTRSSYIHVRAVDAAGNARTATVSPQQQNTKNPWAYILGSIVVLIIIVSLGLYLKKRKTTNASSI